MKKKWMRLRALAAGLLAVFVAVPAMLTPASASGTGAGLAEHAMTAYNEGWSYVYGGASYGAVDCSGLIYMYAGTDRVTEPLLYNAQESGPISTIPRVHGLGLYQYGHVGVYIGNGVGIDSRDEYSNLCQQSIYTKNWSNWFKVRGVSYPTDGWENFAGQRFFYENGQYVVDCTRTIDGIAYTFGGDGALISQSAVGGDSTNDNGASSDGDADHTPSEKPAPPASEAPKKTYPEPGDTSDLVLSAQNALHDLGYLSGDNQTGFYGSMTQDAVKQFQSRNGFYASGVLTETDFALLVNGGAVAAPKEAPPASSEAPVSSASSAPEEPKKSSSSPSSVENAGSSQVETASSKSVSSEASSSKTASSEASSAVSSASGAVSSSSSSAVMAAGMLAGGGNTTNGRMNKAVVPTAAAAAVGETGQSVASPNEGGFILVVVCGAVSLTGLLLLVNRLRRRKESLAQCAVSVRKDQSPAQDSEDRIIP